MKMLSKPSYPALLLQGTTLRGTPTRKSSILYVMEQRQANYHGNTLASMHNSRGSPDPGAGGRGTHERMTQ